MAIHSIPPAFSSCFPNRCATTYFGHPKGWNIGPGGLNALLSKTKDSKNCAPWEENYVNRDPATGRFYPQITEFCNIDHCIDNSVVRKGKCVENPDRSGAQCKPENIDNQWFGERLSCGRPRCSSEIVSTGYLQVASNLAPIKSTSLYSGGVCLPRNRADGYPLGASCELRTEMKCTKLVCSDPNTRGGQS